MCVRNFIDLVLNLPCHLDGPARGGTVSNVKMSKSLMSNAEISNMPMSTFPNANVKIYKIPNINVRI